MSLTICYGNVSRDEEGIFASRVLPDDHAPCLTSQSHLHKSISQILFDNNSVQFRLALSCFTLTNTTILQYIFRTTLTMKFVQSKHFLNEFTDTSAIEMREETENDVDIEVDIEV